MAKLVDLSSELLLLVVSYLATGDNQDSKALFNLCLTSRAFFIIAQPSLYICVRITEPEPDPLKPLKCFLRTILERPVLAKETQKLALINDRAIRYEWPALQEDPYFMDLSSLIGGHPSEIEPDLCYYPLATAVLVRLPNLQHIRFTAEIEPPSSLLQRIHQLQVESSTFSKLRTFHVHKKYENGPVHIRDYVPFLRYPSFERFLTKSDVPDIPGGSPAINTLTPSTVDLYWCYGPPSTFEELLDACSCLTRFVFVLPTRSRFGTETETGYFPQVALRELVTMLLKAHGATMTTLHLDYHHCYNLREPDFRQELEENGTDLVDNDYTCPPLRGFENLTCLTIEFEKLVHVRDLPTALKLLNLQYCYFPDLDQEYLRGLAKLKETWCPAIENVNVSGLEETNEGICLVLKHARALDLPVQVPEDGRMLTFSGAASHLRIQSRVALPLEEADLTDYTEYYQEVERRAQEEHRLRTEGETGE